jgi:hypothetical protein
MEYDISKDREKCCGREKIKHFTKLPVFVYKSILTTLYPDFSNLISVLM